MKDLDVFADYTREDLYDTINDLSREIEALRRLPDETPAQVHTATCPRCFLSFTCTGPDETPASPPEAPRRWRCTECKWTGTDARNVFGTMCHTIGKTSMRCGPVVEDTGSGGETPA